MGWDGTRTPSEFPLRAWTTGHFAASGATSRTQAGPGPGGDAPTGKRAVEVKSSATPGPGPTRTRESEPDGQRDQHSGLSLSDRRWNPGRPRRVHAGCAPDTSPTKSSAESASPSELITPRLLNLRAAANYLGVSPWTIRDLEGKGVLKRVTVPLPSGTELRKLLFDKLELDRLIDVWKT